MLADLEQAVKFYRMYMAQMPKAPNRSLVESRLRTLEKRLAALKVPQALDSSKPLPPVPEKQPAQPSPASPTPLVSPEPSESAKTSSGPTDTGPSPPPARHWKRTAGWVALGTGSALLVTGIVFGALASAKTSDYQEAAKTTPYDHLGDLRDEGEALESTQIGLMVAGGVLAAAGGGLLLWHHMGRRKKDKPGAATVVAPLITDTVVGLMGHLQF